VPLISVIIPALNESSTIENVVRFARTQSNVSEVIVVDDGSTDGTPEIALASGAVVITSSLLGKGASIADGLNVAVNDIVVLLDGDLTNLAPNLVERLTKPIRSGETNFVKGRFTRLAGRVTTLTAKPLLKIFFPELASIEQPLGGIIAAKKSTLSMIEMETDYGVDLGILIDLHMMGERILEVDIGQIDHDSQPLEDLAAMATQVTRTLFHRAERYSRFNIEQLMETEEWERQDTAKFPCIPSPNDHFHSIALFDMDGTLLQGRFITELANKTGRTRELEKFLDHPTMHPFERTRAVAGVFEGVALGEFVEAARQIPLNDGAIEAVRGLRKLGFRVGIITDSFRAAAETVRRRVFADFSLAHVMEFRHRVATGCIQICPSMFHEHGCSKHLICKKNAVLHLAATSGISTQRMIAVGDGENDICMLRTVGLSYAYRPKTKAVRDSAHETIDGCLSQLVSTVDAWLQESASVF